MQKIQISRVEFNFQQDFEFLPAPFDGMFIALNLTWTDGDSTFKFEDNQSFTTPFRNSLISKKISPLVMTKENLIFD